MVFFFKQKTAYEMRISDWSSDVCSSDLGRSGRGGRAEGDPAGRAELREAPGAGHRQRQPGNPGAWRRSGPHQPAAAGTEGIAELTAKPPASRSEEHTSELPSLMRISYAVFCWNKRNSNTQIRDKSST